MSVNQYHDEVVRILDTLSNKMHDLEVRCPKTLSSDNIDNIAEELAYIMEYQQLSEQLDIAYEICELVDDLEC